MKKNIINKFFIIITFIGTMMITASNIYNGVEKFKNDIKQENKEIVDTEDEEDD